MNLFSCKICKYDLKVMSTLCKNDEKILWQVKKIIFCPSFINDLALIYHYFDIVNINFTQFLHQNNRQSIFTSIFHHNPLGFHKRRH